MNKNYFTLIVLLFIFASARIIAQPTITSFSPTSGPIGTTVTINGTNFNTTASNNIVYFGAVKATVNSATSTSLVVNVPTGATYQPITVTVNGLTAYSNALFIVTFTGGGSITSTSFAPRVDFVTVSSTYGIAIGDVDGDGKIDVAFSNISDNTTSIFMNTSNLGSVSFAGKVDISTGISPYDNAFGDLDGDGKLDIVTANNSSNTVSIFRNTSTSGTVGFAPKVDLTTGSSPKGVAIADVDGDGNPDIAVTNSSSGTFSIFRNTSTIGNFSFSASVYFNTNSDGGILFGDIDGDGKPDVVVANKTNTISVYKNISTIGNVNFAAPIDFTTGNTPWGYAIGDLDGDGKLDVAVSNQLDSTVSVFRNSSTIGNISFISEVDFRTGKQPCLVAIGDIDGDGKNDLVVGNTESLTVSVFKNTSISGTVSFASKVDFTADAAFIGDVDGDGKPDLIVANHVSGNVSVLRNIIGGSNIPPAIPQNLTATAGNGQVQLKWNKNTEADFLKYRFYMGTDSVTMTLKDSSSNSTLDTTKLITGLTNGTKYYFRVSALDSARLESAQSYAASAIPVIKIPTISSFSPTSGPVGTTVTITGTNFNTTAANNVVYFGAVRAQVLSATSTSLNVTVPTGATYAPISVSDTTTHLTAYSSKPFIVTFSSSKTIDTSSFASKIDFSTGSNPTCVAIGDLDGDGKPDVVVVNNSPSTISIYRNTSNSGSIVSNSFATNVDLTTGSFPTDIAIGDLDGDGKPDLAVANGSANTISVYRNTSSNGSIMSSSFATKVDFTAGSNPYGIAIVDLDGDGKPDLVVANLNTNTISVLRNTSTSGSITTGSFATKVDFTAGTNPIRIAIGDLDGDGKPDLAVANYSSNSVSVFRNTSNSGSIASNSFATKVDFTTGSIPHAIAIADLDGDGKPDIAVANHGSSTVSVFRNTSTNGSITSSSFTAKVDFTTGSNPWSISIADLDGDGKPDIAVANHGSNTASVFRNMCISGSITNDSFTPKTDFTTGGEPQFIAIGDLDGDGKPDLAITCYTSSTISVLRNTILPIVTPKNLTAIAGNTQIVLVWSKNTEADFLKYRIYKGTTSGGEILVDSSSASIGDTTKIMTGLTNGTTYYFEVTAIDSARLESGFSNEVSTTPSSLVKILGEYTPDASTVLLLHMDETSGSIVSDASSYGNSGIASGTAIVNGRFGKARSFNSSDLISVLTSNSLSFSTSNFTIEAWVFTGISNGNIISKFSSNGFRLDLASGGWYGLWFTVSDGSYDASIYPGAIYDGKWHHVAGVRQGNTISLYIDGAKFRENTVASLGSVSNSTQLSIGGSGFTGQIDEVRISNIARSPQEFNLQLPPKNLSATPSGTTVNLSWQNGGGAVPMMRYKIYRGADSTSLSLIDSLTQLLYANSSLVTGNSYYYRISAVDSTGFEGAMSYAVSATIANNAPIILLSATTIVFGSVTSNSTTSKSLVIANTGTAILTGTVAVTSNAGFSIDKSSLNIAAGGKDSVVITFSPTAAQDYNATLTITHNAAGSPSTVTLIGTGISASGNPLLSLSKSSVLAVSNGNFASTTVGTVIVTNNGNATLSGTVSYSGSSEITVSPGTLSIAAGSYSTITISISSVSVADGTYSGTITITHNASGSPTIITVEVRKVSIPSSFTASKQFTFENTNSGTDYKLFGIPGDTSYPASSIFNETYKQNWRMYRDNGSTSDYLVEYDGSSNFDFGSGRGFWVLADQSNTLSATLSNYTTSGAFPISLQSGWNIISNPFVRTVSWNDVQTYNQLTSNSVIYSWSNGAWSQAVSLVPYLGYYFNNIGNLSTLSIPYDPSGALTKRSALVKTSATSIPVSDQHLKISLTNNNVETSNVYMGFDEHAGNNYDVKDYFAPPASFAVANIQIENIKLSTEQKRLCIEYRLSVGEGQRFNLVVKNTSSVSSLTFEGIDKFSDDLVYLLDERRNELFDLKSYKHFDVPVNSEEYRYSLVIGGNKFIDSLNAVIVPNTYSIAQNYPNPFNPATTIEYTLPQQSYVKMIIFDIVGREVATLVDGFKNAGRYSVVWNATRCASGVYFCRLTMGDYSSVKKLLLMK